MPQNKNKRYSDDDLKYIKENYKNKPVKEIATLLKRSPKSVRTQIERMGLKLKTLERNSSYTWSETELKFIIKNYTNMSDEKISKELGISKSKICRKRIEMGLIKQKKEPFLQGGYYRQYINGKKVWTHRYNAEKKIGRKLKNYELVHHKDGNKTNNDYDNLYVCKDKAEHGAVHDSLEKVAFELYKRGLIRFNEETGEYYLNEQIRTEG